MPYAKTSLRAEQRAIREKMRGYGLDYRHIAVEFGRRYGLRPRAAWRHAYGWSLREAADRINARAAEAGPDAERGTVAMTGPHLCETEAWPGQVPAAAGRKADGRRPAPYLLALLAGVYQCAVGDLLDLADYEHMPPADRLILGKAASPEATADPGTVTSAPSGNDRNGTPPIRPLPAGNGRRPYRGDGGASDPGSGPAGNRPERALVLAAAHESSEHAVRAEASNIGEATLEQLDADVSRIARDYVYAAPLPMFAEMVRVRDRVYRLLDGRQKPAATAHLHLLAGVLCGLLANASTDLGHRDAAAEQARAAWAYGETIGHDGLLAWTRGMQALIEYWSERPRQAVRLAQAGQRHAGSATARARLYSVEARVWSRLGDLAEASRCLRAAADARDDTADGDYLHDEVGGVFGFGDAKTACYAGAAWIHLGQADPGLEAASRAAELYASGPAPLRSYGAESLARVDIATAYLIRKDIAGAATALRPVLEIAAGKRISQLGDRLAGVSQQLAGPGFGGAREARDLIEIIGAFRSGTAVPDLPLPGPPSGL